VQISLLKSIATITNKAKVQILLPTIQLQIVKVSATDTGSGSVINSVAEELATRVLSCYDSASAQYLNESAPAWDVFVEAVYKYFRSGKISLFLQ